MWACEHLRRKKRREREREREEEEEEKEKETSRETTQSSLIRISDVITMSLVGGWQKTAKYVIKRRRVAAAMGGPWKLPHVENLLQCGATNTRITRICKT